MAEPIRASFAAVFLDRDGVINEEVGLVREPGQLQLIEGTAEAIRKLNQLKLPVIVVTNQPVVARGWTTEAEVELIHQRLRELLAEGNASVDAIYFCPHHENADDPTYRKLCDCRKPRPGMLLKAAEDWDLDLKECVMIGDRTVDLQAAREAGCATAFLVETGFGGNDGKCDASPDLTFANLKTAVAHIEACQNQL